MIRIKKIFGSFSPLFAALIVLSGVLSMHPAMHDMYADVFSNAHGMTILIDDSVGPPLPADRNHLENDDGEKIVVGYCPMDIVISNLQTICIVTCPGCSGIQSAQYTLPEPATPFFSAVITSWSGRAPPAA